MVTWLFFNEMRRGKSYRKYKYVAEVKTNDYQKNKMVCIGACIERNARIIGVYKQRREHAIG